MMMIVHSLTDCLHFTVVDGQDPSKAPAGQQGGGYSTDDHSSHARRTLRDSATAPTSAATGTSRASSSSAVGPCQISSHLRPSPKAKFLNTDPRERRALGLKPPAGIVVYGWLVVLCRQRTISFSPLLFLSFLGPFFLGSLFFPLACPVVIRLQLVTGVVITSPSLSLPFFSCLLLPCPFFFSLPKLFHACWVLPGMIAGQFQPFLYGHTLSLCWPADRRTINNQNIITIAYDHDNNNLNHHHTRSSSSPTGSKSSRRSFRKRILSF